MCYIHTGANGGYLTGELSTLEWKKIFDDAIEAGLLSATLSGGECMVRKDFRELYLYLFQKGVHVSINTNGSLIDAAAMEFFRKYPPEHIQISLYGSCDEVYSDSTGCKSFTAVKNALAMIKAEGFSLTVALTPTKQLLSDLPNMMAFLCENEYSYKIGEFLLPNSELLDNDCSISQDDYVALMKKDAELHHFVCEAQSDLPEPFGDCSETTYGMPCNAATCRICVDWQGNAFACYALPFGRYSIAEYGFAEAWKKVWQEAAAVKLPIECNGCAYRKACISCPAIRMDSGSEGHCSTFCCDYAKKLCAAGLRHIV